MVITVMQRENESKRAEEEITSSLQEGELDDERVKQINSAEVKVFPVCSHQ